MRKSDGARSKDDDYCSSAGNKKNNSLFNALKNNRTFSG